MRLDEPCLLVGNPPCERTDTTRLPTPSGFMAARITGADHRVMRRPQSLRLSPLCWLKLQLFLHAGETEVGGFGISAEDDLLYLEEFVSVKQRVTAVRVAFDDPAVADHFDTCLDRGLHPRRCGRIWVHTHPGESPEPSSVDEETFARAFGGCDWSVMFIIGRTGRTYARLSFNAGPGGSVLLPVSVDWSAWPELLLERSTELGELFERWMDEYGTHIHPAYELNEPVPLYAPGAATQSRFRDARPAWSMDEWEEERTYGDVVDPNALDVIHEAQMFGERFADLVGVIPEEGL